MPSPFPGMDPYIESPSHWKDFHGRFINTLCEAIADTLPEAYFARIQEDVVLLEPDPPLYRSEPDVLVATDRPVPGARSPAVGAPGTSGGVVALEPTTVFNLVDLDPHTEYFIEVLRLPDAKVVTVVEVLSPTNKGGGGRGLYTNKRSRLLRQPDVNLVEVDLLRGGRRVQLAKPFPSGDYHALVSRADRRPACDIYSWSVRDRLPTIPIPLRAPEADASADLAGAFRTAYDRGRYGRIIRYSEPPPPPSFSPADAEWVRSVARGAG